MKQQTAKHSQKGFPLRARWNGDSLAGQYQQIGSPALSAAMLFARPAASNKPKVRR